MDEQEAEIQVDEGNKRVWKHLSYCTITAGKRGVSVLRKNNPANAYRVVRMGTQEVVG